MWRLVDLARTDVSEERVASILKVESSSELGTTLAVTGTLIHAAAVVPSSLSLSTFKMEVTRSSEASVRTKLKWCRIPDVSILHTHCQNNLISYIALTSWALQRRRNVSPMRYELGCYIPEDSIFHSHRRENLKFYIALTSWALQRRRNVSPMMYELGCYSPEDGIFHSHRREHLKFYIYFLRLQSGIS
jgi:hypothetical protein